MNKEVTLEQIITNFILFIDRNKKLIFSVTLSGVLIVVLFQKLKPAFYATTAIVTSGISEYQDIEFHKDEDVRNQRLAINLINDLQIDIDKEDYASLSQKLRISLDEASMIKSIEAEPLLRQDKDEKFHNTSDFIINMQVRDDNIIEIIEGGLEIYFESNEYIDLLWNQFILFNNQMIEDIEKRISHLEDIENQIIDKESISSVDLSTLTFSNISSQDGSINDNIIALRNQVRDLKTINLIKPITYTKKFTRTTVPERQVLVWGTTFGILSFFLSLILSLILEIKRKQQPNL